MSSTCAPARNVLRYLARTERNSRHIHTATRLLASSKQTSPMHGYIADLLDAPLHSFPPTTSNSPAATLADEQPMSVKEEKLARARVVFGSRLLDPVARQKEIDKASTMVAGIMVPPKPEEPDNCCMSGCVNCVWDRFRDELEEWAMKSTEARQKATELRVKGQATGLMAETGVPGHVATSMDDDGGGSDTGWDAADGVTSVPGEDDGGVERMLQGVPVGIREFMKMEKKLKQRHAKNGDPEAIAS